MELTQIFIWGLGIGVIVAIILVLFNRRAARESVHQAEQVEHTMEKTEAAYYQERVEETIRQMRVLENKVTELQNIIEMAKSQYEGHVNGLYAKVDGLVIALDRANKSLDIANETIAELREEVKRGNRIITMLQDKITKLLEDKAENR
jgi:predicted RNase H-like nuclease (RuvC/YqgF family)